jgi:anti-anti-sigma factor
MGPLPALPPLKADPARDVTGVHFTGSKTSLGVEALHRVRDQLLAFADAANESDLLLDFGNVDYVCSMALDMLATLHKKLLASGRRMTVCNPAPQVHEVFAAARMDKRFDLRLAAGGRASGRGWSLPFSHRCSCRGR